MTISKDALRTETKDLQNEQTHMLPCLLWKCTRPVFLKLTLENFSMVGHSLFLYCGNW